jgi:arylsulfatase
MKFYIRRVFNLIQDPKELYPIDKVDVTEALFMAPVSKKIVAFRKSLTQEPPIRLGTPDPYMPPKRK